MSFIGRVIYEQSLIDFCNIQTVQQFIRQLEGEKLNALDILRNNLRRVANWADSGADPRSVNFARERHKKRYRFYVAYLNGQIRGLENILRFSCEGYQSRLIEGILRQDINNLERLFNEH